MTEIASLEAGSVMDGMTAVATKMKLLVVNFHALPDAEFQFGRFKKNLNERINCYSGCELGYMTPIKQCVMILICRIAMMLKSSRCLIQIKMPSVIQVRQHQYRIFALLSLLSITFTTARYLLIFRPLLPAQLHYSANCF